MLVLLFSMTPHVSSNLFDFTFLATWRVYRIWFDFSPPSPLDWWPLACCWLLASCVIFHSSYCFIHIPTEWVRILNWFPFLSFFFFFFVSVHLCLFFHPLFGLSCQSMKLLAINLKLKQQPQQQQQQQQKDYKHLPLQQIYAKAIVFPCPQ